MSCGGEICRERKSAEERPGDGVEIDSGVPAGEGGVVLCTGGAREIGAEDLLGIRLNDEGETVCGDVVRKFPDAERAGKICRVGNGPLEWDTYIIDVSIMPMSEPMPINCSLGLFPEPILARVLFFVLLAPVRSALFRRSVRPFLCPRLVPLYFIAPRSKCASRGKFPFPTVLPGPLVGGYPVPQRVA